MGEADIERDRLCPLGDTLQDLWHLAVWGVVVVVLVIVVVVVVDMAYVWISVCIANASNKLRPVALPTTVLHSALRSLICK